MRGVPLAGEALGVGELGGAYGSGVGRALGFGASFRRRLDVLACRRGG